MNREEKRLWKRFAAACMGCGKEQIPLPKVIEMWICDLCHASYEGVPCFCCGLPLGRMGMCDTCDDPEDL